MLENQMWIHYAKDLHYDWLHALEEGKDVEELKEECFAIKDMPADDPTRDSLAEEMYHKLLKAPMKKDFAYNEPSDLKGIKAVRPDNCFHSEEKLDQETLYNKIYGAWLGRVAGCLLGKPVEGWRTPKLNTLLKATDNYPLNRYMSSDIFEELKKELELNEGATWINKIDGKAPTDDDTNYTVLGLKILERYGRSFSSHDVAEAWLSYMPYLSACTAERVAYKNIASGIFPTQSAIYKNPFREWIGAQIRADFYGYINPGEPEMAAEMAWRDAAISHVKNGIYGEMFVAAMLAAACVTDDMREIIDAGLGEIPEKCRLAEKIQLTISWYKERLTADTAFEKLHELYDENDAHHWCHTISNAMIVVLALLYGNKDFEKSICLSVQTGFDTDCNGATVGSIVGMILGADAMPEKWISPFHDVLTTTIQGYEEVKLSDIAQKTLKFLK